MGPYLFYGCLIAFAGGAGVQTVFYLLPEYTLLILLMSLGVGVVWRRNHRMISAPFLLLVSTLLCSFALGVLRVDVAQWQLAGSELESSVGQEIVFIGVVTNEPKINTNSTHLFVQSKTDTVLVTTDRHVPVAYGDVVSVSGQLKVPEKFTTELGRTFDYPGYLKAKGVEYTLPFAEVIVEEKGRGNIFVAFLLTVKYRFMNLLEAVIPEPHVGLGEGLLLGVKQALGEDIETDFRRTGIIHIVVLSGYNVMLVVTFFMLCFSFFLSPKKRVVAGVVAIVSFALLVGLSATVVRASIMASLLLFAQGFGRQYDVMRALFFAGAVMLFLNPYLLLYDIGFQLSFMATLGLLLITPHFESTVVTGVQKLRLKDFFLATVATQIAVLPLLMYHIGEVSLVSVVVNVLILPVVPVAMFLTFLTGLIAIVSAEVAAMVGFGAYVFLGYILFVAQWFAQLPFAVVTTPEFSVLHTAVLYCVIAAGLLYLKLPKQTKKDAGWTVVEETESPVDFSVEKSTGLDRETLPKIFR
jgi:competence protein ComEC